MSIGVIKILLGSREMGLTLRQIQNRRRMSFQWTWMEARAN